MNQVKKADIIRRTSNGIEEVPDLLAVEEPLEIRIGYGPSAEREQTNISITMRTPGNDFELAAGFLFTEGVISAYEDIVSIHYCEDVGRQNENNVVRVELSPQVGFDLKKLQRHFYTTSSCGVCGKGSIEAVHVSCAAVMADLKIKENVIVEASARLRQAQHVFEYTGGLHAAGLFDSGGELTVIREDVGRHNALDKVIGAALASNLPMTEYFVVVSGRASFELIQKSAVAGIPVIVAVGAPSSLAVDLAEDMKMTLVGFVHNSGFNIYCGKQRIILKNENQDQGK